MKREVVSPSSVLLQSHELRYYNIYEITISYTLINRFSTKEVADFFLQYVFLFACLNINLEQMFRFSFFVFPVYFSDCHVSI